MSLEKILVSLVTERPGWLAVRRIYSALGSIVAYIYRESLLNNCMILLVKDDL